MPSGEAPVQSGGAQAISIRPVRPGDIGFIIHRHAVLYGAEYNFDSTFEYYVAASTTDYLKEHDPTAEQVWVAEAGGQMVGSIGIVWSDLTTAQLRWFLIEPACRGLGLGKRLLETALSFARTAGYGQVFLWTVDILAAARHLYQRYGFEHRESVTHRLWGHYLTEERWDLKL